MKKINHKLSYLALAGILGLSACGGSQDTTQAEVNDQSSVITGVITGFGSVFIDGVEYETDGSSFSLNGVSGTEDDLAIGMVVTLQGTVNLDGRTGIARSVSFANELEGLVSANRFLANGSLDVMGQTVHIDAETVFESKVAAVTDFSLIAVDHVVEVSGFSSGDGNIYATRIEVKKMGHEFGDEIEIKGLLSAHDELAQTFMIGSLNVDYSSANLEGLSSIVDGLYVEVKSDQAPTNGLMIASKVELEDGGSLDDHGDDGEEREFEGVVTLLGDDGALTINGQQIYYDADTEFEKGMVDDLVVGMKVKVEAEFDVDGQLYAHELKFKVKSDAQMEGVVEVIDIENSAITLMGQMISFNNLTIMKDERDDNDQTPVRYFGLDDLAVGDWVEVHSYRDEVSSDLIATKFERDDGDSENQYSLEGVVEMGANEGELVINSVVLDLSVLTGVVMSVGEEVEVEGSYSSGVLTVSQVEFED